MRGIDDNGGRSERALDIVEKLIQSIQVSVQAKALLQPHVRVFGAQYYVHMTEESAGICATQA